MDSRDLKLGIIGGLVGGAVFGMMMAKMGVLPMIGKMVGQPSSSVGFLVHMVISGAIGGSFGLFFGRLARGIGSGAISGFLYGGIWWLLGPLTLMPLFLGMGLGVNWNVPAAEKMLSSLMGHAIFGVVLGISYAWFRAHGTEKADAGGGPSLVTSKSIND